MADLLGKVLDGKYRLVRRLGSGGVGTVYEAVHVVIGRKVAIKVLKPEYAGSPTLALRLVQEAKAASAIDHPSIIKVFDAGRSKDGLTFLVMELLVGEELAAHIKQSPVPLHHDEAVDITADVLDALVAAHARGIIHRDLKPENVFLTRGPHGQRWVKLLDFGIAKIVDHKLGAPRLTHAGTIVGTPFYMAPEHARGARDLDARVDVYATGVMLFEMLTKRVPFEGHSYNEVLASVLSNPFPRPRKFNESIPEGLEAVILRATAKDRDARFPTATAFLEAIEPYRPESPSSVFHLSEAAQVERERTLQSAELEMLPEEAVPTMAGEPESSGHPPTVPPRGDDEKNLSSSADAAAAGSPMRDSGPSPTSVARAETLRLPSDVSAELESPESVSPVPTLREAGTLAGSLVPVERSRRQRLAALAAVGVILVTVAATLLWAVLRGSPHVATTTLASDAGTVSAVVPPPPPPVLPDAAFADIPAPAMSDIAAGAVAEEVVQVAVLEEDVAATDAAPADGSPPDGVSPDAGPGKVTIRIVGVPVDAKVFVDGTEAGNPFQIDPSDAEHKLRIVARGFAPYTTSFSAPENMAIAVRLTRQRETGAGDAGAVPDTLSGQLLPDPHFMPH